VSVRRAGGVRVSSDESSPRAGVAAAFDLHFDPFFAHGARRAADGHNAHRVVRQASDIAAIGAEKMGMLDRMGSAAGVDELEPPDVVAEVRARDEPDLHQVHEIAVHGGAVEARGRQAPGDVSVAERRLGRLQPLQDRDARSGTAQAHGPKRIAELGRGANGHACSGGLSLRHLFKVPLGVKRGKEAPPGSLSASATFQANNAP
jgi:hypothetical protein